MILNPLTVDEKKVKEIFELDSNKHDQTYLENLHAHEQQEDYEYISYLEHNFSVFSDFSMDRNVHHAYDQFPNHFEHAVIDDCIDSYMFFADHSQNVLSHAMQLSYDHFYEEEISFLIIKS